MKGKKGIIRSKQRKSERNSDDDKLDEISAELANFGYSFARNVFLVFDAETGRLLEQGHVLDKQYQNKNKYQINNCDIVVKVLNQNFYIELDGEAIHGICDCAGSISEKTRERNRRYTKAGLIWFTINEALAKSCGLKSSIGSLAAFLTLSHIQKIIAIGDINEI
tara:strand:- start:2668 stop:3162 length:495 start_codon:yes stop_codon:yes gene_type:complete